MATEPESGWQRQSLKATQKQQQMIEICRQGDEQGVIAALATGHSANCVGQLGMTPLMAALEAAHVAVTQVLLDAGADPNRATATGNTALRLAVQTGSEELVTMLLSAGADVNLDTARGTALIACSVAGDTDIASVLLDNGADPNLESREGSTALLAAVRAGQTDMVHLLLQRGADPGQILDDGYSAVMEAEVKGDAMLHALLMQGVLLQQADQALEDSDTRQRDAYAEMDLAEAMAELRELAAVQDALDSNSSRCSTLQQETEELMLRLGFEAA